MYAGGNGQLYYVTFFSQVSGYILNLCWNHAAEELIPNTRTYLDKFSGNYKRKNNK